MAITRAQGSPGLRQDRLAEPVRAIPPANLGEPRKLDRIAEGIADCAAKEAAEDAVGVGKRLARPGHRRATPDVLLLADILDRARPRFAHSPDGVLWSDAELHE